MKQYYQYIWRNRLDFHRQKHHQRYYQRYLGCGWISVQRTERSGKPGPSGGEGCPWNPFSIHGFQESGRQIYSGRRSSGRAGQAEPDEIRCPADVGSSVGQFYRRSSDGHQGRPWYFRRKPIRRPGGHSDPVYLLASQDGGRPDAGGPISGRNGGVVRCMKSFFKTITGRYLHSGQTAGTGME